MHSKGYLHHQALGDKPFINFDNIWEHGGSSTDLGMQKLYSR